MANAPDRCSPAVQISLAVQAVSCAGFSFEGFQLCNPGAS
jgi:hypothetical protein